MSDDNTIIETTIGAFILDTQIKIFEDVREDKQKSLAKIAEDCRIPYPTVAAWACGRNGLTLSGVKLLLRAEYMRRYLSRLFEPELCALVRVPAELNHDQAGEDMSDYLAAKHAAHHPESEAGREIGPGEDNVLRVKFASVAGGRSA